MDSILFWVSFSVYAVAAATNVTYLAVARLFLSQVGAVALALGFALETAMLTARSSATGKMPLQNPFEWVLVAAWIIAGISLIFMSNRDPKPVRALAAPLIVALYLFADMNLR